MADAAAPTLSSTPAMATSEESIFNWFNLPPEIRQLILKKLIEQYLYPAESTMALCKTFTLWHLLPTETELNIMNMIVDQGVFHRLNDQQRGYFLVHTATRQLATQASILMGVSYSLAQDWRAALWSALPSMRRLCKASREVYRPGSYEMHWAMVDTFDFFEQINSDAQYTVNKFSAARRETQVT